MGGLGKTTLARKIYNNIGVRRCFECRAWVYVSLDFKIKELLLKILKQMEISNLRKALKEEMLMQISKSTEISDNRRRTLEEEINTKISGMQISDLWGTLEGMGVEKLKKQLFKCLQRKRYLIVMDDIWKTEFWAEARTAFPDVCNGSRILITSRIKEVASHARSTSPYFLPFLDKNESWELFTKKVFRGRACPPELETLGRKIADDCRGLPLSIVVLGGLLSNREKTSREWSKLIGNVNWYLTEANPIGCKDILALSYTNLPPRLQPCFLYFGVYPEDFEISARQLIHLWTVEGFIHHTGNRSIEDVAEDYLEELIDRSLIQVSRRATDGGVKKCHIHDLLRDLCISESKKDKFLELLRVGNLSFPLKSRRLSFHGDGRFPQYNVLNFFDPPCARSLLFFDDVGDRDLELFIKNFKLIRVLNLECIVLQSIPKSIETMILLRYLRIKLSESISIIPDFFGNLRNLETLFIDGVNARPENPVQIRVSGIFKLQRLRNLYLKELLPLPYHLDEVLWNLRVLSTSTCWSIGELAGELDKFPFLRELKIRFMGLFSADDNKAVHFLEGLHHLRYLQKLKVYEFLIPPSDSISFPLTITQLTLEYTLLPEGGGMTVLGNLPNLRILKIKHCYGIRNLHVFGDSFPTLEVLKLGVLSEVGEWKQEEGAMPCLRYLVIRECFKLTKLPPELWSLTALQKVEVLGSNSELAQTLRELQMRVRCKLVIDSVDLQPSSVGSSSDIIQRAILQGSRSTVFRR